MSSESLSDYENLLWNTASSDSSDLDMPTEKIIGKENKTDSQSDTEEKYKLLKDIDYTITDKYESSPKKSKKRKMKEEPEDSDRASLERKKIKTEPTSDTEVKRKKKKKDKKGRAAENCTTNAADHSEEGQAYDESFLNLKVKQETFAKPSPLILNKKHKNQSPNNASSEQSDTDTDSVKKKKSKKKRKNSNTDHSQSKTKQNLKLEVLSAASESENSELQRTKKKKSKKKRKNNNTDLSYSEIEQNEQILKQELLNAAIESENSELQRTEKKKSKKKRKNSNTDHSYSETEQNLKQELLNAASESENSELQKTKQKKSKKKRENSNTDHSYSETEQNLRQELLNAPSKSENSELPSNKKKKSKKNAEPDFYPSNEFVMDDDSSGDEVKVPIPVMLQESQRKKRKESLNVSFANTINKNSTDESQEPTSKAVNGHISAASSDEGLDEQPSNRKVSKSVRSISSQQQDANYGSESDNSRKRTTSKTKSLLNATAPVVISRRRISERIAFEDEDESQSSIENKTQFEDKNDAHNDHITELSVSAGVDNYLLKKNTLKHVTTLMSSDHLISDDDDIWIIKCPHDVDINSMNGVYLSLESKCKIRVNDQSYEGNIEEDINRLIILSSENKQYVLKNIPVKGTIRFRKRIPKPHMREDNIMPNNQTNFIPLPETKCRHPLFGINYKPALNLPSAIAQRLCGEGESFAEPVRSKKRKQRESITEPEPDTESEVVPKKKKRKHKHTDHDEEAPTKSKKIKRDPDAAEVWESEQAIEENLFNF